MIANFKLATITGLVLLVTLFTYTTAEETKKQREMTKGEEQNKEDEFQPEWSPFNENLVVGESDDEPMTAEDEDDTDNRNDVLDKRARFAFAKRARFAFAKRPHFAFAKRANFAFAKRARFAFAKRRAFAFAKRGGTSRFAFAKRSSDE